jgi:signal transduction histidine kinase
LTPEGRRLRSLGTRGRILAAFVVLLVLSELLVIVLQSQILDARTGERVDDSLSQEVEEFRRLVVDGNNPLTGRPFGGDVAAIFDVFLSRNVPSEGEAVYTFLGTRPYRATTGPARNSALRDRLAELGRVDDTERGTVETGAGEVRYLAVPVNVSGRRRGAFVVTADLGAEREEVTESVRVTAGVSLGVLFLASGLAFLVAGRVLNPLRDLTETARSITDADLTRRIDVSGSGEIAELARTFNDMLDRLEAAFATQRAFVSDASHELRTPITIVRGHLELLGDDPDERRDTVALVTDELDRMTRFVEDLLTLARAETADFVRREALDLDVLTEELMAKVAGLADRDWQFDGTGNGVVVADRQRLTQAVMSLAQNAVEHTAPGDRIALGSALADGQARLWVADSGPGVAPADRDRIFERFARAGGSRRRSDGAGLGLAIVRAIAEAHGGRVELDSRPGHGAQFTLVIPTDEEEHA